MSNDGVLDDTSTQILYVVLIILWSSHIRATYTASGNWFSNTISPYSYNPESAWKLDQTLGAYQPFQGTVHGTTQVNATASLSFTGELSI
jgi:hypothetical protein